MRLRKDGDFQKHQGTQFALENLAVAPTSPGEGQAYFDTVLGVPRVWDGAKWLDIYGADDGPYVSFAGTTLHIHNPSETFGASIDVAINGVTVGTFNLAGLAIPNGNAFGWGALGGDEDASPQFVTNEGGTQIDIKVGGNFLISMTDTTIGFLGASPVARQANASQGDISAVTDASAKAALQALYNALVNLGLCNMTA